MAIDKYRTVFSVIRGFIFFFQAKDGIRDLVLSRGLGDVYFFQANNGIRALVRSRGIGDVYTGRGWNKPTSDRAKLKYHYYDCPLYTSDAADE